MDSAAPAAVNGGVLGHGVFCQGGGPAGSSNVPVGTHTPVKPRSPAVRDGGATASPAVVELSASGGVQAAAQHTAAMSAANRPTDRGDVRRFVLPANSNA